MIIKNKIYTFPIITFLLILFVGSFVLIDIINENIETHVIIVNVITLFLLSLCLSFTKTFKNGEYLEISKKSIFFKNKEYIKIKDIESIIRLEGNKHFMKKSNFAAKTKDIEVVLTSFDFNLFLSEKIIEDFIENS